MDRFYGGGLECAVLKIHPTAVVDPGARISSDVEIGAYSVIGGGVSVAEGTWIGPHVHLSGDVMIGRRCRIYPFAVIGTPPQDRSFTGGESRVEIGDDNTIREHVTIHSGTPKGGRLTSVGNRNWFLVGSHVAHDCRIGDDNTFANGILLAGHVQVASNVMVSGVVAVHQFCRIGRLAMVSGMTGVPLDVPPFVIVQGARARVVGLNRVGLKRAGVTPVQIRTLQEAYRLLFREKTALEGRLAAMRALGEPLAAEMADFVAGTKRGICTRESLEPAAEADPQASRSEAISAAAGISEK